MKLLAIETATEACSVALAIDRQVLLRSKHAPREHADLLLPWVGQLLAEGDIKLQQLDALVFSRGPGSFTSLRIGISVAQGLAWGVDIPVIPVSSLQATAQVAAKAGVNSAIVALDARMNEVYCGTFRTDEQGLMQPAGHERVCAPEAVTELQARGWTGIGNGFERYPELAAFSSGLEAVDVGVWPLADSMLPLAEHWLKTNQPLPASQAQPVYIRDKVAEKSR